MWPDSQDTEQLLSRVRQGGSDAADELLARHRAALRNLVAARLDQKLARRVDASDVVQDVLLEASQRLPEYLKTAALPFANWLRQIACDRMIDLHRRHRVAARRSIDREQPARQARFDDASSRDLLAQLSDPQLTPAAQALRAEMRERFLDAIDQLAEDDREILLMRHFEQLSNSQAAVLLGLSEAAAGMRHLRALRRLRDLLRENTGEGSL
jgi:RNA polymerase sigma-70 factor (ECF subfamily)